MMDDIHSVAPSFLGHQTTEHVEIEYSENEDEVDQLDSDSEVDSQDQKSGAPRKKTDTGGSGPRLPGQSLLPSQRLENMIQADGVTGNLAMSKEAVFILSIATEEFIKRMILAGQRQANTDRRNHVTYRDMAFTTQQYQEFMFLQDTIPPPISITEAFQRRDAKLDDMIDEDPATSQPTKWDGFHPQNRAESTLEKRRARAQARVDERVMRVRSNDNSHSRAINGWSHLEDTGRSVSVGSGEEAWTSWSEDRIPSRGGHSFHSSHEAQNGVASTSFVRPSPPLNGSRSVGHSRAQTNTPSEAWEDNEEMSVSAYPPHPAPSSTSIPQDERWPGQYMGPASGFLQDPRVTFGRAVQNPGRTIYSQQPRLWFAPLYMTLKDDPRFGLLPIIDIAPYINSKDVTARASVCSAIHRACVDFGFFYLDISKHIDPSEPEELTRLAREFFALPQEEKDKIALKNQDGARGYARLLENVTQGKADNHEGIDLYRPVDAPNKSKPLWGENQWPSIPGFQEKYNDWVDKMKKLGLIVMEAMATGLGMTSEEWTDLRAQVDDSFWVMRIIGYPPLPNDHDGFSCGAHKDYGCLTFLYADPTPSALQVLSRHSGSDIPSINNLPVEKGEDNGVWINADPIPGCIVCNIGEMWEIWSNGLYKSTLHRVIHRGSNYRVSIPFFFEPNFEAHVEPLQAALRLQKNNSQISNSDERLYKPVKYGEFLMGKVGSNFADGKGKYDA